MFTELTRRAEFADLNSATVGHNTPAVSFKSAGFLGKKAESAAAAARSRDTRHWTKGVNYQTAANRGDEKPLMPGNGSRLAPEINIRRLLEQHLLELYSDDRSGSATAVPLPKSCTVEEEKELAGKCY